MGAQPAEKPSLAGAHERLADLLDELEITVELAGELANAGADQSAIDLIDRQRRHLYQVVDEISKDVGHGVPARARPVLARKAGFIAAAVVASLSCVAVSIAALREPPAGDRVERARNELARVALIGDPAERLERLVSMHEETALLEATSTEAAEVHEDVTDMVRRTAPDVPEDATSAKVRNKATMIAEYAKREDKRRPPQNGKDAEHRTKEIRTILEG